jgi:ketosteroid isomerase-like protein
MIARLPLALLALLALMGGALAHPLDGSAPPLGPAELEIMRFRQEIVDAVKAKDAARLREIYADGFTHTHGSGKVDGKNARIVSVLAGDPSVEMAPADELFIRVFGTDTAVVTGRSPILNVRENRDYDFRWIAVYVRVAGQWKLAASQATRLPRP